MKHKLSIISLLISFFAAAQDLHWSQPAAALLYQNPAFTGVFNKYSASLQYRNQWNALNTAYNSFMINGDYRFNKDNAPAAFALGAIVSKDISGEGSYQATSFGLTSSCFVKLNPAWKIGAGLGLNVIQNSIQPEKLSWGAQYDAQSQAYNGSWASGEQTNLSASRLVPDLNAGISLAFDKGQDAFASNAKHKFVAGYSINHITRPNTGLTGSSDKLNMKHTLFAYGVFSLKDNLALKPTSLLYLQGRMMEITAGCLLRYGFGQQSKITGIRKGSALAFGALYRVNDAIIPCLEFEKGPCIFGLSYDVNVSSLSPSSHLRGGIELSARIADLAGFLYKNAQ